MAIANTGSLVTNFNVTPYYDDFDESKNFYRILFRPGFAVQARELTQLQTVLQNQIDRFGEHVFREGSAVTGLALNYDSNYFFIKVRDNDSNGSSVDASAFVGTSITGGTSNVVAIVVNSETGSEAEDPDLKTLYVKYIDSGGSVNQGNVFFSTSEVITANSGISANVATAASSVGRGTAITVGEGIIFAKDHFVRVPEQTIVVGKYASNVSFKIGYTLTESVVSSADDSTLLDPAQGSYNYTAPGANRLKIDAALTKFSLTANTGSSFIELLRIKNGSILKKDIKPQYSEIRDYLAERTKDINGSFITNGLNVRLREHLNQANNKGVFASSDGGSSDFLVFEVEPGKVYVDGYDYEFNTSTRLPVQKGLSFESKEQVTVSSNYGNYLNVNQVSGVWDVNDHAVVTLFDTKSNSVSNTTFGSSPPSGKVAGTARARAVEYSSGSAGSASGVYKLYLYDVKMTGNTFSNVRSVRIDNSSRSVANGVADVVLSSGSAVLNENDFNKAVFKLPADNIRRLRDTNGNVDTTLRFLKRFNVTVSTGGTFTLATGNVDERYPFGTGALTDTQKRSNFYMTLNGSASTANVATGDLASGSNTISNVTGASTKFNVGDLISVTGGYANTFTVTSVGATTLSTLETSLTDATVGIEKQFRPGQVIDLGGVGGDGADRSVTISSDTSASFDIQEPLSSTVSATVITELNKVDAQEAAKNYNSGRYVQVTVNQSDGSTNTTGPWNLGFSDIHKITEVRRKTGNSQFTTSTEGVDVTTLFNFDTGQKDNIYDHGKLVKKSTSSVSAGDVYLVKLNYFTHDTSQGVGYFSVDSYPIDDTNTANTTAITTQEIPVFKSPVSGESVWLRDTIDIRPRITDTSTDTTSVGSASVNPATSTTITSPSGGLHFMPPNESLLADLDFYLARRDMISISPQGKFKVTSGRASLNPIYPEAPVGDLPIARVHVPPYPSLSPESGRIYNRNDLTGFVTPVRTNVFTMKDIGRIKSRVDRLEYYTKLTYLEAQAKNLFFADSSGIDRFKNGIIVDSFTGHNIGNVFIEDYKASIDIKAGELRPPFKLNNINLEYQSANSSNIVLAPSDAIVTVGGTDTFTESSTVTAGAASGTLRYQVGRKLYLEDVSGTFTVGATASQGGNSGTISAVSTIPNGKGVTLPYSHDIVSEQPFATTTRNLAGLFWNFAGRVTLSPDTDFWVDTTTAADVQINFESNLDNWGGFQNGWQSEWGNWQTLWTGENAERNAPEVNQALESGQIQPLEQVRTASRQIVVPETQQENIGPRVINTNLIPFMRSRVINVEARGMKPNTRLYAFFDDTNVNAYVTPADSSYVATGSQGDALISDSDGVVYALFEIPNDSSLQFRVGDKKFRLTDSPNNSSSLGNVTTAAETIYSARGITQTTQDTIISMRLPQVVEENVVESRNVPRPPPPPADPPSPPSPPTGGGTGSGSVNNTSSATTTIDVVETPPDPPPPPPPPTGGGGGKDPSAQTIRIDDYDNTRSSQGAFLTKIDLFFQSKDATRGAFVEIREVDPSNGALTRRVVPLSKQYIQNSDINISENGSSPTPVYFNTPIFLKRGFDYGIVVRPEHDNPTTVIWSAKLGETDLISGQRVTSQPHIGRLLVSSNDRGYTAIDEEDMKFRLYVARFNTAVTGTAVFKNEDIDFLTITGSNTFTKVGERIHGPTTMVVTPTLSVNANFVLVGNTSGANGLVVSQSSNTIVVNDVSTSAYFRSGERVNVVIDGVKQPTIATVHSVSTPNASVDFFDNVSDTSNVLFITSVNGTFTDGAQIKGQTNGRTAGIQSVDRYEVDLQNLNIGSVVLEDTLLNVGAKFATSNTARDTSFLEVEQNENTYYDTPKYILSKSNESALGSKSAEYKVNLTTSNPRHSPMIDIERMNTIIVDNKINNDSTNETNATGGNALAKYITRTLALEEGQDAEDLVVKLSAYKPNNTELEVYYKILNKDDDDAFEDRDWVEMTQTTFSTIVSDSENTQDFKEFNYAVPTANLTGSSGEVQYTNSQGIVYTGFKYMAIKIVMKSSSEAIVPRVRDLIAIALQI